MNAATLKGFIRKELVQTLRDKRMRVILFVAPVIQLTLFGLALTNEVKNIRLAVAAPPGDRFSEHLAQRCEASGYFRLVRVDGADPFEMINADRADAVLVAPPGGLSKTVGHGSGRLQLLLDASNATRAQAAENYVQAVLAKVTAEDLGVSPTSPVALDVRTLYNPALESSLFMVPAVLCMLLTMVSLILTSSSISREKEMGTFETLIAAPVAKWEILLGKTVPYVLVGIADVPLVLTIAVLLFHVPVRGPLWMIGLGSFVFICAMVSLGTFLSTITRTQQQSMMASFLTIFPIQMFSGLMFPLDNLPAVLQPVKYINPLAYQVTLVRNVMLKGGDPHVFWSCVGGLAALAVVMATISYRRFSQTLN